MAAACRDILRPKCIVDHDVRTRTCCSDTFVHIGDAYNRRCSNIDTLHNDPICRHCTNPNTIRRSIGPNGCMNDYRMRLGKLEHPKKSLKVSIRVVCKGCVAYFFDNSDDSNINVFCCLTVPSDNPILRSVVHCYCCWYFRCPIFYPTDILDTHWPAYLQPRCDLCCWYRLQLLSNRLCRQNKALDSFRCEHRLVQCV